MTALVPVLSSRRGFDSMGRAAIGCMLLIALPGCSGAEKESLKQFLEASVASLGQRYDDQLRDVPDTERNVRFRVLFARDQLAAADGYLKTQPPIGPAARQEVEGYRKAKAEELALFEGLLNEKRYVLTDSEKQ